MRKSGQDLGTVASKGSIGAAQGTAGTVGLSIIVETVISIGELVTLQLHNNVDSLDSLSCQDTDFICGQVNDLQPRTMPNCVRAPGSAPSGPAKPGDAASGGDSY